MKEDPTLPSGRYRGESGKSYFAYQQSIGELGGRLNLLKFSPYVSSADAVLDFGCGGGFLLEHLNASSKIGVEVNSIARSRALSAGLDVRETIEEVPDGCVDVVISNHALEHVREPYRALVEMRRVLKGKGRLILWLPIDDWRLHRSPDLRDPNGHLYTWTPLLIRNLLNEVGFVTKQAQVVTHAWPPKVEKVAASPVLFRFMGGLWSVIRKRRQLFVHAERGE